jgi:hypothetical protein
MDAFTLTKPEGWGEAYMQQRSKQQQQQQQHGGEHVPGMQEGDMRVAEQ